jgi:mRNA deadenylase 3'-5' endonuclease subunit Ccr4
MQMNTLADWLSDAFPHTNSKAITWAHRKGLLLQEIFTLMPDVVCLEEVDHFEDHFYPALKEKGYEGYFKKKNAAEIRDGCALFYRTSRFEFIDKREVNFPGQSQVALLVHLRLKLTDTEKENGFEPKNVFVGVTHLKAKGGFEEKRLAQGQALLQQATEFICQHLKLSIEKNESKSGSGSEESQSAVKDLLAQVPLLMLGDFNDVPTSLVCTYFRNEPLQASGSSSGSLSGDTSPSTSATSQAALTVTEPPHHPFVLASAYAAYDETGVEPYSTFKKREYEVIRTIDYIWYTSRVLTPVRFLEIPHRDRLTERLPCLQYPSDHLALWTEFAWVCATGQ